jgi:multiple sugar transport system substrate-binding protein
MAAGGVAMVAPLAACGGATSATLGSTTASASLSANTGTAASAAPSTTSAATQSASLASTAAATTSSAASTAAAQAATTTSSASTAAAKVATTTSAATASIKVGTPGVLTFMLDQSDSVTQAQYQAFLKQWNDGHANAQVQLFPAVSGGDAAKYEKIQILAAAGTPVDIVGNVTFIQPIAKPGAMQPIDPFIAKDKYDISGYNQGWLKTFGSWSGKQYSLPWGLGGNALAFIYNPNMFATAGITPPSQDWKNPFTWDLYREYAQKLTKKQGTTYTVAGAEELGDWDYTIPMQWGAHWVSPDGTKAICNSPEMIQGFTSYLDMILKDQTDTASPAVKLSASGNDKRWAAGQTAMSWIGGWQIPTFTDPANIKNDYVIATFPKGTVSSPDQDAIQLGMGANIKDPASAWAFMQWLLQDGRYAKLVLRMPALTTDARSWATATFAKMPSTVGVDVLINSLAIAQSPDPVRAIPANAQFEDNIATPLWKNLLAQKVTVADGFAQAQTQLQALLDQSNK